MLTKREVARRELGAALALFIEDRDPVAIHVLACAGAEISEQLTIRAGRVPFRSHVLETIPGTTDQEFIRLRNKYCNAFKHLTAKGGAVRDDQAILEGFSDYHNEALLFVGWRDYRRATGQLPIEAQVFELWFLAKDETRLAPGVDPQPIRQFFPGIAARGLLDQKRQLQAAIERVRADKEAMSDPATDSRPLFFANDL